MKTARDILNNVGIVSRDGYGEGEHRTACPVCATVRHRPNDTALAAKIDAEGAVWTCHRCGFTGGARGDRRSRHSLRPMQKPAKAANGRNGSYASDIWRGADPIEQTLAARYLRTRGITIAPLPSHCLRFHPSCPRRIDANTVQRVPALLGAFTDIETNTFKGVQRIFLARDGFGKSGKPQMLGSTRGGAVKLTADDAITYGLAIAEGIETALAAMTAGFGAVWAVGCADAIKSFPILSGIECLTIFADNDENGVGQNAGRASAERYVDAGIEAQIICADKVGLDFNDIIKDENNG